MGRIVASIEARTGASRLPGKVLKPLGGAPVLSQMLRRVRASAMLDDIVIATTDVSTDDAIAEWAASEAVTCFRGSENDVLDRVIRAHQMMQSDVVVELCGDCPLIEPQVIDLGVESFLEGGCDLVSTVIEPSFPAGVDVEVFHLSELERVGKDVRDPVVREHVSSHFYQHPEKYRLRSLLAPAKWRFPDYRFLLDYPEDLAFLQSIFTHFEKSGNPDFNIDDVLSLLRKKPHLLKINQHRRGRSTK
jgi:spore coat polysaccharide biosynthesis protein SpsF